MIIKEYARNWQKQRRLTLKALGLCTYCGKEFPPIGRIYCDRCRVKRFKPHTHPYSPQQYKSECLPIQSIYLSGPIDLGSDINWKELLVNKLKTAQVNVSTFDPASAFKITDAMDIHGSVYIEDVNNKALDLADLMICSLPSGVQTIGTIIELDRCIQTNKEVWIITDININKSVYLRNRINPKNVIALKDKSSIAIESAIDEIVAKLVARG